MATKFEEKCRQFFDAADKDGNGALTKLELVKLLKSAGDGRSVEEINDWYDEIDRNDDDRMTFDEMWNALNKRDPKSVQESELRAQFREIDADGSGKITADEVKRLLGECGCDETAQKYVDQVDKDGDDKIDFEEFLKMWKEGL